MARISVLFVITALAWIQASPAQERTAKKQRPDTSVNVASAASESNFVFRGTVKKPGGTTLEVVPASASTAIVHVDEILDGSHRFGFVPWGNSLWRARSWPQP